MLNAGAEQVEDDEGSSDDAEEADEGSSGDEAEEADAEDMDGMESAQQHPAGHGQAPSDDEDMDDEAMFRMDDKLAAYFRAMQRGGAGKQVAAALLSLRLRVVVLLEEFAKRCPHSPLLPSTLPTLLEALRRALRNPAHEQVRDCQLTLFVAVVHCRGAYVLLLTVFFIVSCCWWCLFVLALVLGSWTYNSSFCELLFS